MQHAMRMSHIVICGLLRSTTLFHIFSSMAQFKKNIYIYIYWIWNVLSIFSTTCVWNIFHSTNNWGTDGQICILVFMENTRYSCSILMEPEFSWQISEKNSNIKYHENPSNGRQVLPSCGQMNRQTDKHDEAYSRFSQFCESGYN